MTFGQGDAPKAMVRSRRLRRAQKRHQREKGRRDSAAAAAVGTTTDLEADADADADSILAGQLGAVQLASEHGLP